MSHDKDAQFSIDTGLICLSMVARFYGLPADPRNIAHQFGIAGKHFNADQIALAARQLQIKSRVVEASNLDSLHFPVLAQHKDGHFFMIAGANDKQVLIQDPLEQRTLKLPYELFYQSWNNKLILFTRRSVLPESFGKFNIGWFLPVFLKYKKLFMEVLMASFFIQLFALVTPLFFQVIIDKVLVHKGLTTLDVLVIGLLGLSLFEIVLSGLRAYVYSHTTNRVDVVLGSKLYKHLLALPMAYFESRRVGDSVARVRELENIRQFFSGSALTLVIDVFFTLVFFAVLYYFSPLLTAVVAASIPAYLLLSIVITPLLRKRLDEKFSRGAENQAFLVETVSGIQTVKAAALEPQMKQKWDEQLADYVKVSFIAGQLSNFSSQIAGFINKVTIVMILWVGAILVIEGQLTVGQLIAFNMIAGRISGPILRLVQLWQDFQQAYISVERLGDILNTPTEPGYNPGRTTLPAIKGDVKFENVRFRYDQDGKLILDNISIHVKPGQVIGVVGRSGSGKSTLSKLIQRLHVPESGRVLIDGVDLSLVDTAWLRRQIGVVLQENFLFNRTIRENIALADPGISMDKVVQASKLAGAHEFILGLSEGYDTLVTEQGRNLSGGQRQRIAIARALVSNPRILVFDEATSALDYESESIIQENMKKICEDRTVFVIAHRLSAVRHADRIFVLDQGKVIEEGPHRQLLDSGGRYAGLHAIQAGTG